MSVSLPLVAICAALVSASLVWLRLRLAGQHGLDTPNHRSLHSRPTPHGGGLGIVGAALACGLWLQLPAVLLITTALLALLSWIDDWRPLPFWARLLVHLGCATWAALALGFPPEPLWLAPLVLALGWLTNAFNFMDGADGLAGSMSLCGFAAYAAGFALGGEPVLATWSAAIAAAAAGFLCFNWHPARIFMGDVGSIPLGFLAGVLGLAGWLQGCWPAWFAPLVFAPFLLDASFTLLRRALAGKPVWQAHREHLYQRMVIAGLDHRSLCLRWAPLMAAGGACAVLAAQLPPAIGGLLAASWLGLLALLGLRTQARLPTLPR